MRGVGIKVRISAGLLRSSGRGSSFGRRPLASLQVVCLVKMFVSGFHIGVHGHNRDAQRYRDTRGYTGLRVCGVSASLD